ncbi:MAG TPA: hypothetical protein VNB22_15945 [Pyrinomonadaceae bacterium]|jgi:hypothetical protein|nr:hypothetical protein [Pyrinomonadaceae bacterium]
MKQLMRLIAGLIVLFAVQSAFGQGSLPPDPNNREPEYVRRMRENREYWDRINRGMIASRNLQPRIVPRKYPNGKPYTKEELARIEALKKPDAADAAKYAGFLKQSKTGLFRLFPFLACEEKNLIRVDGECANFIPDGWAYSFRAKGYSTKTFFDLKFEDENLVSGSPLSLGVLTSLGDVPLENVSLASDGMKYLAAIKPETGSEENKDQTEKFARGVESGGYKYSDKIKIEENVTYGLRVVAYRLRNVRLFLVSEDKLEQGVYSSSEWNEYDERDDVTLAFRIVRKENDNITILWKELSRRDAPKLVFPKDTKKITVIVKSN